MRIRNKRQEFFSSAFHVPFYFRRASVSLWLVFVFVAFPALSYSTDNEKRYNVPIGDSPAYGPANAPVTIIEFLDYQ